MVMIGGKGDSNIEPFVEWWAQEDLNDLLETTIKKGIEIVESFEASGRSVRLLVVPKNNVISFDFIGNVFGMLDKMKNSGIVVDYSVTQNSLEQVFRAIANEEEDEEVILAE
jgi:hypothetical protein